MNEGELKYAQFYYLLISIKCNVLIWGIMASRLNLKDRYNEESSKTRRII